MNVTDWLDAAQARALIAPAALTDGEGGKHRTLDMSILDDLPKALDALRAALALANDIDPERHECAGDYAASCSACWADDIRGVIATALEVQP